MLGKKKTILASVRPLIIRELGNNKNPKKKSWGMCWPAILIVHKEWCAIWPSSYQIVKSCSLFSVLSYTPQFSSNGRRPWIIDSILFGPAAAAVWRGGHTRYGQHIYQPSPAKKRKKSWEPCQRYESCVCIERAAPLSGISISSVHRVYITTGLYIHWSSPSLLYI